MPVQAFRPLSYLSSPLRAAVEHVRPARDLVQGVIGRGLRGQVHHAGSVLGAQPRLNFEQHILFRVRGFVPQLVTHRPAHVDPPLIERIEHRAKCGATTVDQPRGPVPAIRIQPTTNRAHGHTELARLRLASRGQRDPRRIHGARFPRLGVLAKSRSVAGEHLTYMADLVQPCRSLPTREIVNQHPAVVAGDQSLVGESRVRVVYEIMDRHHGRCSRRAQ